MPRRRSEERSASRPRPATARSPPPRPRPAATRSSPPRPRPRAVRSPPPRPRPRAARSPPPRPRPTAARSPPPRPRPAAAHSPPPQTHYHAPPPRAKSQASSGGSMFSGWAWGIGNAVAQRAVDALMGPRTIKHETVASESAPVQNTMASTSTSCDIQSKAFQDCVNNFGSDISKCQFYMDMLSECKKNSASTLVA